MNIYQRAINKWGPYLQTEMIIEECSELIHACCKFIRSNEDNLNERLSNLAEEIADVEIMCSQGREIITGYMTRKEEHDVDYWKKKKLARLRKMLDEH